MDAKLRVGHGHSSQPQLRRDSDAFMGSSFPAVFYAFRTYLFPSLRRRSEAPPSSWRRGAASNRWNGAAAADAPLFSSSLPLLSPVPCVRPLCPFARSLQMAYCAAIGAPPASSRQGPIRSRRRTTPSGASTAGSTQSIRWLQKAGRPAVACAPPPPPPPPSAWLCRCRRWRSGSNRSAAREYDGEREEISPSLFTFSQHRHGKF